MDQERNGWIDALSEQDIPAEAVDWESIVETGEDEELRENFDRLDAEATIGELPAVDDNLFKETQK
ncbi:hypothetical protein A3842_20645 [Paenibacillus sp. P3E]|uniref:hypothetical protein n=1 Tax=Paenibacillus sp. P3E TaxID=1349435 RepID=UPI0009391ECA|nr:hypothetical protein [Paenibacillus sp. P3E]OKP74526.1 hypothetical protein A3842_20645 [Paenibacillus sp. P3E]